MVNSLCVTRFLFIYRHKVVIFWRFLSKIKSKGLYYWHLEAAKTQSIQYPHLGRENRRKKITRQTSKIIFRGHPSAQTQQIIWLYWVKVSITSRNSFQCRHDVICNILPNLYLQAKLCGKQNYKNNALNWQTKWNGATISRPTSLV